MESEIRIIGVLIKDREKEIGEVQRVLSKFGCSIRTRLGLHETDSDGKSCGLIILELNGDVKEMQALENNLKSIQGVEIDKMSFA
jgi:hypothetical protein